MGGPGLVTGAAGASHQDVVSDPFGNFVVETAGGLHRGDDDLDKPWIDRDCSLDRLVAHRNRKVAESIADPAEA